MQIARDEGFADTLVNSQVPATVKGNGETTEIVYVLKPGAKTWRVQDIVIDGVSKAYAMTGFRIGYACGPVEIIEAMMKVHQYTMLCASIISQEAAIEAIEHGEPDMVEMRDQYQLRRNYFVDALNRMGLECHTPRGSFYAFPDISKTGMNEKDFAIGLLQTEKVAMVPGTAFGEGGKGFCRACFATSYEQLIEASNRIERHVASLAAKH